MHNFFVRENNIQLVEEHHLIFFHKHLAKNKKGLVSVGPTK
jgi:hypothetical protein